MCRVSCSWCVSAIFGIIVKIAKTEILGTRDFLRRQALVRTSPQPSRGEGVVVGPEPQVAVPCVTAGFDLRRIAAGSYEYEIVVHQRAAGFAKTLRLELLLGLGRRGQ